MAFSKTIQMFIFDGNPNGRIMCELSNWNGRIYKVSRSELAEFSMRSDAEHTGVYFLLGKDDNNFDTVYIGEAEKVFTRLKQHLQERDAAYWSDCIVVISKDNLLNKAYVKYLENSFYHLALNAHRSSIINSSIPTCSSVSEYDEAMLQEFISNTKLLVNTLGYKIFDSIEDSSMRQGNSQLYFYIDTVRGAKATGIVVTDGFAVLKDSSIASNTVPSISSSIVSARKKLVENGIVNSEFRFISDYIFSSPSMAASVVMGRNANGRTEWRTADGKTLKSIEEERLES